MVNLEIDNRSVSVDPGTSIIEAAEKLGIYIPRFCYHKKLSIAANCRMCLVEVEKVGKPLPACATPVTDGMKVYTTSPGALEAQRIVMEFLLINHPLDCPICDQGGECDLQDQSMGYGESHSYYEQSKRAVFKEDIGPLIETEMTRCIQCTRCVRFGEEVAGMRELGVTFRGEHEQIGTYVKHMMKSEVSANIIDLCPVGALTAKPYRYGQRGWEMTEHPSIAPHDCVGTHIFIHSRGEEYAPQREMMRIVPRENMAVNETWISDRDRFGYLGLKQGNRLLKPRVKHNGKWKEVDWQPALLEIADRTQAIIEQQGADQVAALLSPNSTVETCYIWQKWLRALGSSHIDHRIRQQDFSDQHVMPEYPNLGIKIADLEHLKAVLFIGSHVRYEQPLLGLRFNKAAQDGAVLMAINPKDYHFTFGLDEKIITADTVQVLTEVVAAAAQIAGQSVPELSTIKPSISAKKIAEQLHQAGDQAGIFVGEYAVNHPEGSIIRTLIRCIAQYTHAKMGAFTDGANTSGAWLAGAVPHRGPAGAVLETPGSNAQDLLSTDLKRAYFLLNIEPEMDCAAPAAALEALRQAGLVVCLTPFITPVMEEYADFILPITPPSEMVGTFVNVEGVWQSFAPASVPHGQSKPAWKIARVLANLMELPDFDDSDEHALQTELQALVDQMPVPQSSSTVTPPVVSAKEEHLIRLAPWLMYRVDNVVRRAEDLQQTMGAHLSMIAVHSKLAEALGLKAGQRVRACQGQSEVILPLRIDDRLAHGVVFIPSALEETAGFGQAGAPINLYGEDA